MRILITGGRKRRDVEGIAAAIAGVGRRHELHPQDITVVDGACPTGADRIAHEAAAEFGCATERYDADWDRHGKAAGGIRNQVMVDTKPDICLAFPDPDSRGTWDCVRRAREAGIPVEIYEEG
jgi:hypothetical protein